MKVPKSGHITLEHFYNLFNYLGYKFSLIIAANHQSNCPNILKNLKQKFIMTQTISKICT
jgi:hypothetical protein